MPRITTSGQVSLEIEQEISHVSSAGSSGLTPTVSQRKCEERGLCSKRPSRGPGRIDQ
ncbi:hypothetical protein [Bradyrhizobium sp. STM 3561]|uniref:hypothetical protein n=1 Tax=Bradyrhizobium sp. STM 3561 TaxID=578923 RepID=UPI00388EB3F1